MVEFVRFPPVTNATDDGLLAMGGDLEVSTLISAYAQGIFPWFNDDQPVLWWSPDPRLVLLPGQIKMSRSLTRTWRRMPFRLTCNQAFDDVVKACALRGIENTQVPAAETWITPKMHSAYYALRQHSYAHSIEVWQADKLVGGLYGVALGDVFFGESMFSRVSDASKIGLVALCHWLCEKKFNVIDCQVTSNHLLRMGATEIPRERFLEYLTSISIDQPCSNFAQGFENFFADNAIK